MGNTVSTTTFYQLPGPVNAIYMDHGLQVEMHPAELVVDYQDELDWKYNSELQLLTLGRADGKIRDTHSAYSRRRIRVDYAARGLTSVTAHNRAIATIKNDTPVVDVDGVCFRVMMTHSAKVMMEGGRAEPIPWMSVTGNTGGSCSTITTEVVVKRLDYELNAASVTAFEVASLLWGEAQAISHIVVHMHPDATVHLRNDPTCTCDCRPLVVAACSAKS